MNTPLSKADGGRRIIHVRYVVVLSVLCVCIVVLNLERIIVSILTTTTPAASIPGRVSADTSPLLLTNATASQFVNTEGTDIQRTIAKECTHVPFDITSGLLEWKPAPDKYLVAMCSGGQLSNRLICLRRTFVDGALLGRKVILPATGIDYNYNQLLDLDGLEACFGDKLVLTLAEFEAQSHKPLHINLTFCHRHVYDGEEECHNILKQFRKSLGIVFDSVDISELRTTGPFFKYSSHDFRTLFESKLPVIAFANMFGVGGGDLWSVQGELKVKAGCGGILQPSQAIQKASEGFINAYLGSSFAALHLRRGDFFYICRESVLPENGPCMFPIAQVGRCLAEELRGTGATTLFVGHNAEKEELELLQKVLVQEGVGLPIISVPKLDHQKWADPILLQGLGGDAVVLSLLEKTICAMAKVFVGTPGSTFSADIWGLRNWWQFSSSCDGHVCGNLDPEYVRKDQKEVKAKGAE